MENHTIRSHTINHTINQSLELTPSFPYEIDKIQENGHFEISVLAYRYWHRHRNRHVNITIAFYTVQTTFKVKS